MRGRRKGGQIAQVSPTPHIESMEYLIQQFLSHMTARSYSLQTINTHRIALSQFGQWSKNYPRKTADDYQRNDLEAYQLYLYQYISPRSKKNLGINTQLARLGCIARFFGWLCRSSIIRANPAADLDLPRKQAPQLPKTLSCEQICQVMHYCDTKEVIGLRNRCILELLYATGVRRSELVNLELGDVDLQKATLIVRKGKNGKSRVVPTGQRAAYWLGLYLQYAREKLAFLPNQTALFLSGYGEKISSGYLGAWVKKILKACNIKMNGSCHLFRHSCATHMHQNGAGIRHIQEILGHERLETTQIYTHLNISELSSVHQRTHPHGMLPQNYQLAQNTHEDPQNHQLEHEHYKQPQQPQPAYKPQQPEKTQESNKMQQPKDPLKQTSPVDNPADQKQASKTCHASDLPSAKNSSNTGSKPLKATQPHPEAAPSNAPDTKSALYG